MGYMPERRTLRRFHHGNSRLEVAFLNLETVGYCLVLFASKGDSKPVAVSGSMLVDPKVQAREADEKTLFYIGVLLENEELINEMASLTKEEIIAALKGAKEWLEGELS